MRVPTIDQLVRIPVGVNDLESFRRWARSDHYPEKVRISYLRGEILVDPSMEQIYSHNRVKSAIGFTLFGIVEQEQLGQFFSDGVLLSNPEANVANEPDGTFVSFDALRSGRVRCIEASSGGPVELVGSPDMVLEVVSPSTLRRDTVDLLELYYQAGIEEYWLVDARSEKLRFEVFHRGPASYESIAPDAGGWLKSEVFGRFFALIRSTDQVGDPRFTLETRS